MATLKETETGALRPVPARMVVGRAGTCALRLDDKRVSGEHATLAWNGSGWVLRDLGSRNGTFVDAARLEAGVSRAVAKGACLGFGRTDGFELVDDGAPAALAQDPGGGLHVAQDGVLALPGPGAPEVMVYVDSRGRWIAESGDGITPVNDGDAVRVGNATWTVRVPASLEGTATVDAGPSVDAVRLRFGVSLDEEHVQLTVIHRGKETKLDAREHGYILLTLARARLADAAMPLAEQGWIDRDQLLKMLGIDGNSLNVGIYRARGQLSAAGLDGAASIVEVRRGQRRFGIEPDRVEITAL
jgi:hypothetical protein